MSTALLSRLGAWWVRFFGRTPPEAPVRALPQAEDKPAAVIDTVKPAAVVAVVTPPPEIDAADVTKTFLETVQLSRPPMEVPPVVADPMQRAKVLEALEGLQQIPSLQSLAQGFMRAAAKSDAPIEEVVESLEKDPALCVRVLRMANSAAVGSERRIEDIFTAVQMLGLRRVRTLAHALFTMRDARHVADGLDWRHLWIHALATAAIAEEIERELQLKPNAQLYLAALLHDVGKIALSTVAPEIYRGVLVSVWNDGARLNELERRQLGIDHSEAGVIFGKRSGLPEEVIATIAHHTAPQNADAHQLTIAIVSLANYLSKAYGLGFSGARLDESDGDFESQPGWKVIEAETGVAPDILLVNELMPAFIARVKPELQSLREAA